MAHTVEWFRSLSKRKGKYNNSSQWYNGNWYQSKLEARYAEHLDWLVKAGDLLKWEKQVKLELVIAGHRICNYYIDFKEHWIGGDIVYTECKGFETELWRLKWKLTEALWPNIEGVEEHATLKIVR